jgi:hypothetical protein
VAYLGRENITQYWWLEMLDAIVCRACGKMCLTLPRRPVEWQLQQPVVRSSVVFCRMLVWFENRDAGLEQFNVNFVLLAG